MNNIIHLDATTDVKRLARLAFPRYNGRTFKLNVSGNPVNVVSYWDGGSRDYFAAINLVTGATMDVPQNGTPFDGGPVAPNGVNVPPGFAIVEHSIFAGHDSGLTFYVHPSATAGLLPAPVDITNDERTVLTMTTTLKNTYGGETDIRFRKSGLDRNAWDMASDTLKSRKLINKVGAITTAGQNTIA